jgi:hypothetical protein
MLQENIYEYLPDEIDGLQPYDGEGEGADGRLPVFKIKVMIKECITEFTFSLERMEVNF